ncbi:MAG TPA: PA-phosphatase [Muricauda sp.]|uniref:Phosphatase PAP2 family protein n=1 Tax=Flagellimonas aurea TaxID=2915619 RepID=A0ABS3G685_9FLAO|nr:phosphatase PAP2 family protein [Allomuricauda aurea]MAO17463.1 PA-phosphatase [Allomuricauda sp.]MBC71305.1 PA-phosphatase [Allomuricauda sp.]MBO0354564.1 phosphatase PAP2 family protein [Allomuricauda aurea]HBU79916.1 PA-phosphatase [Allomuricauda sp.]|tara:strand:+ start:2236 stop:2988 length:753 start_codon:yes stop_codon:yes gene_type:complete
MRHFKKILFFLLFITAHIFGQSIKNDSLQQQKNPRFKYQSLIIPASLITYGVIGLESHQLKFLNSDIKNEINEHIDTRFTIDDISQYTPFLSVYGLNAFGIKGKHNFKDRTIILGTAYLIMGATVNTIKKTSNVERPDGSSKNSFPSGHTATAFMGAEFLYQEYKHISPWYGIMGYTMAAGTGFFRIYNDRHWLTDVAAGAGIGMLSAKIAYWIHPFIKNTLFKDKETMDGAIVPFYNGEQVGLGLSMSF